MVTFWKGAYKASGSFEADWMLLVDTGCPCKRIWQCELILPIPMVKMNKQKPEALPHSFASVIPYSFWKLTSLSKRAFKPAAQGIQTGTTK
eukprot:1150685-Pelagomonas_calceolata.AAC.3